MQDAFPDKSDPEHDVEGLWRRIADHKDSFDALKPAQSSNNHRSSVENTEIGCMDLRT